MTKKRMNIPKKASYTYEDVVAQYKLGYSRGYSAGVSVNSPAAVTKEALSFSPQILKRYDEVSHIVNSISSDDARLSILKYVYEGNS